MKFDWWLIWCVLARCALQHVWLSCCLSFLGFNRVEKIVHPGHWSVHVHTPSFFWRRCWLPSTENLLYMHSIIPSLRAWVLFWLTSTSLLAWQHACCARDFWYDRHVVSAWLHGIARRMLVDCGSLEPSHQQTTWKNHWGIPSSLGRLQRGWKICSPRTQAYSQLDWQRSCLRLLPCNFLGTFDVYSVWTHRGTQKHAGHEWRILHSWLSSECMVEATRVCLGKGVLRLVTFGGPLNYTWKQCFWCSPVHSFFEGFSYLANLI